MWARRCRMNATRASGTEATCASQTARLARVAPRNVMKTPVDTQTIARVKIARPAYLARLFHIRIIRFAWVTAKTKNGTAMSDAEHEVEKQHRVEKRRVAREGRDEDGVGRDQAEGNEEEPVEAPLPGLAGRPRAGRDAIGDILTRSSYGSRRRDVDRVARRVVHRPRRRRGSGRRRTAPRTGDRRWTRPSRQEVR